MKRADERSGELLHAKHALMPNILGHCGPDENGRILEHLHSSTTSERLLATLSKFEAAYPFIRMIAKSTGRDTFDYEVPEAYWLGNGLLERVRPSQFFEFAHQGLGSHLTKAQAKAVFRELGSMAKPHHTFYVLSMFGRGKDGLSEFGDERLLRLMDSCRISWGRVTDVREKALVVESQPLAISEGALTLGRPKRREVEYDREIRPFTEIGTGDWVSVHWGFASERLTKVQLRNLSRFTAADIEAANRVARLLGEEKQR